MICFDLDMTLFFSFRYFCRLLIIAVLWSCSTSSFACIERQIKNVSLYEPNCEFSVNRKESTNNKAYVQFQYQKKNLMETMQVMQSLTSSLPYAISIHSYQNGFRSMVGPVEQKDIAKVKRALAQKGYRETLVKYLASNSDSDSISQSQAAALIAKSRSQAHRANKKIAQQYVGYRIGKVGTNDLIVPVKKESNEAMSNRVGRFAYQDAKAICQGIQGQASIATVDEYAAVLSSTEALNKIGLSVPFWLTSDAVITRSSKGLERRAASPNIQYNVLCSL